MKKCKMHYIFLTLVLVLQEILCFSNLARFKRNVKDTCKDEPQSIFILLVCSDYFFFVNLKTVDVLKCQLSWVITYPYWECNSENEMYWFWKVLGWTFFNKNNPVTWCFVLVLHISGVAVRTAAPTFWWNLIKIRKSVRLFSIPHYPHHVGWGLIIPFLQRIKFYPGLPGWGRIFSISMAGSSCTVFSSRVLSTRKT